MFINWMALWNIYRGVGRTVFILACILHCIGKERKVKGFQKIAKVLLIITAPLIILAFLEAIGINEVLPVLNFALYDFF